MHENDAEKALVAIQEESEVRGAAAERFEYMVAMALEAWDATFLPGGGARLAKEMLRRRFERAVRQSLAKAAQVYELEIGASERMDRPTSKHHERSIVYLDRVLVGVDHDDEGPFKEGWEIHVRVESGDIHILFLARRSHRSANQTRKPVSKFPWVLRSTDTEPKVWGVFEDLGDALQMALDPTAGRED